MAVSANALCTLDDVKDFLNMSGAVNADDELIMDLIDSVTDIFEIYCGVKAFKLNTYTEYYDGDYDKYIFPNNTPIVSVLEINDDTDWIWATDTTMAADTYRIVDSKYIVLKSDNTTNGDQNIKLRYTAGYATIPNDLKQICIEESSRRYKNRMDFDVISKTLDDGTVQYTEKGLLTTTKDVLNKYNNNTVY